MTNIYIYIYIYITFGWCLGSFYVFTYFYAALLSIFTKFVFNVFTPRLVHSIANIKETERKNTANQAHYAS